MKNMIENWLAQDPNPETRAELSALWQAAQAGDASASSELEKRFSRRLQFGTAGLRGPMQVGLNGMNRVVVAQTAAGLAQYLKQESASPSIVIAYDGRHQSKRFALDSAEIMAGAGIRTHLMPEAVPTPLLAFAVRALGTSAGVMVTASHNPPRDNGYKVFWGEADAGSQIISPRDKHIAAAIEHAAAQDIRHLPRRQDYQTVDEALLQDYAQQTARLAQHRAADVKYVYTAMHGVGKALFYRVLDAAHYPYPIEVKEQIEPNPDFPSVRFPNPEEPGALDLALNLARQHQADCVLAHDPDADRLGVAIPDAAGQWQVLHGNQIAMLLAWHVLKSGRRGTLAGTMVSSPAIARLAQHYGQPYQETLTGFKYVSRVPHLLFGFEESLGYLVDADKVRDKDGISAALMFLDLLAKLKQEGRTVAQELSAFYAQFGYDLSAQITHKIKDLDEAKALLNTLRQKPWTQLGTEAILQFEDGRDRGWGDLLIYRMNGARLLVRPSGTEPKIKFYLDVNAAEEALAQARLQHLKQALSEALQQLL